MVTIEHKDNHITGITVTGFGTAPVVQYQWSKPCYQHDYQRDMIFQLAQITSQFTDEQNFIMWLYVQPNTETAIPAAECEGLLENLIETARLIQGDNYKLYNSWSELGELLSEMTYDRCYDQHEDCLAAQLVGYVDWEEAAKDLWHFAFGEVKECVAPDGTEYVLAIR